MEDSFRTGVNDSSKNIHFFLKSVIAKVLNFIKTYRARYFLEKMLACPTQKAVI